MADLLSDTGILNIVDYVGDDIEVTLAYKSSGTLIDLSAYAFTFTIKASVDAQTTLFTLTSPVDIQLNRNSTDNIYFLIPRSVTTSLGKGSFAIALFYLVNGLENTLLVGKLKLSAR